MLPKGLEYETCEQKEAALNKPTNRKGEKEIEREREREIEIERNRERGKEIERHIYIYKNM